MDENEEIKLKTSITFYILPNGDLVSSAQNEDTQCIIDKLTSPTDNPAEEEDLKEQSETKK